MPPAPSRPSSRWSPRRDGSEGNSRSITHPLPGPTSPLASTRPRRPRRPRHPAPATRIPTRRGPQLRLRAHQHLGQGPLDKGRQFGRFASPAPADRGADHHGAQRGLVPLVRIRAAAGVTHAQARLLKELVAETVESLAPRVRGGTQFRQPLTRPQQLLLAAEGLLQHSGLFPGRVQRRAVHGDRGRQPHRPLGALGGHLEVPGQRGQYARGQFRQVPGAAVAQHRPAARVALVRCRPQHPARTAPGRRSLSRSAPVPGPRFSAASRGPSRWSARPPAKPSARRPRLCSRPRLPRSAYRRRFRRPCSRPPVTRTSPGHR